MVAWAPRSFKSEVESEAGGNVQKTKPKYNSANGNKNNLTGRAITEF